MSFDALTFAGMFSALLSGGFLIGLASKNGANQAERPKAKESDTSR
jgi:hypothetical protein